jgi:hypothetical protein
MASKRSVAALIAVALLLPSCVLTRLKSDGDSSMSRFKTSSREHNDDLGWGILEYYSRQNESAFAICHCPSTDYRALVIRAESKTDMSGDFGSLNGVYIRPSNDGDWFEYKINLTSEMADRFRRTPLVICGCVDNEMADSTVYHPGDFELTLLGEEINIPNQSTYADLRLEKSEKPWTFFNWESGVTFPFVEGLNTIRFAAKGPGTMYVMEFWIMDPLAPSPYSYQMVS